MTDRTVDSAGTSSKLPVRLPHLDWRDAGHPAGPSVGIRADGKHFVAGGRPWRMKGVTYGTFCSRLDDEPFPEIDVVKRDFRAMVEAGFNTVRTYSLPPNDVLDAAADAGLGLFVGLHYHDWRMEPRGNRAATRRVHDAGLAAIAEAAERLAGRPEVLALAVGNEIPNDVVRVHGIGRVERTLSRFVRAVHEAVPNVPVTYVNFPTTEFLDVDGQDFVSFNVFLEDPGAFRRYARHLQVVARDRPLVISELGLASGVYGEAFQAETLRWQLATVDEAGVAGAAIFSWTDEWGVAGEPVEGWGFGITDAARLPKPALEVASDWAARSIEDVRPSWPRISVVVCAYNEEATIEECLDSVAATTYPELEVVVCDDGSTDRTLEIVRAHERAHAIRVVELQHGGLSRARNAGADVASGDIVAYLDADAACHPDWPFHLALSLEDDNVVATGGPNLPVPGAELVGRAVALSPGSPVEVLVSDDRAEHVPGCNMAYRRSALEEIGGFDAQYVTAGDDVDACWKLLDRGYEIAFAPAAQVRHHRRDSVRRYLKQQRGYGRAERMLTGAHPHRFNRLGQARWAGAIYGGARLLPSLLRPVVYHGHQGTAPFQPVTARPSEFLNLWASALLPLMMPAVFVGLALGAYSPWFLLAPAVAGAVALGYGVGVALGARVPASEPRPIATRALVGLLHVLQPAWRAYGRIRGRPITAEPDRVPEWWGDRGRWLLTIRRELERRRCSVVTGGPNDTWDLQASNGLFVRARITTAVVWRWVPQQSVVYRLRPVGLGVATAFAFVAVFHIGIAPAFCAGALLALALIDSTWLQHRVHRALRVTSAGGARPATNAGMGAA